MFPVSVRGTIRLPAGKMTDGLIVKAVIERIADLLYEAEASTVTVEENTLHFTVAFSRPVSNWNLLVPFNNGKIAVEAAIDRVLVRYDFRTTRMLIGVSVIMCAFAGLDFFAGKSPAPPATLSMLATGWLWLFGMNYVTGMIRVPLWLRKGLRDLPELVL